MSYSAEDRRVEARPLATESVTLARLWERIATQSPDAACILYPGRHSLSYESLYSQVLRVQRSLRQAGFGPSSRVAGALPDGAEASVAFFSVSAACAYVPLNVAESRPFFDAAFRRLEPSAVLVSTQTPTYATAAAQGLRIPLVEIDPLPSSPAGLFEMHFSARAGSIRAEEARLDDLALLLLTSGATGEPKFVMHSHRTLLAAARILARSFHLDSSDRCLNISPLFHSLGLTGGLMMAAVDGGSMITTPRFQPDLFYQWMDEYKPTWFSAVPYMLEALHSAGDRYQHVLERGRLKFFRTAGAPLNPQLAAQLESHFHAPLTHVYGMSEAPPIAIQPLHCRKRGSVGVAAGLEMVIRNEEGTPMPQGEIGEVTVRGAQVTTGYFGDPDATDRAFRNGFFHTGDLGYHDAEGHLFLTGRIHDIISRGGEKICPSEIESAIETHPEVLEAIAFPVPHPVLDEEVAIAVVRAANSTISAEPLQRYAASRLAFHKIPRQFLFLERIPLLPSGKPDRRHLPRLFEQNHPVTRPQGYAEPRNRVERLLASVWAEVLGVKNPGIHDSFFESDGDSLTAITLLAAVSQAFQRDSFPNGLLFESPTIAEMAVLLSSQDTFIQPEVLPIQPSGSRNPLFCIAAGFEYRHLSKLLNPDQPLFSIRVQSLEQAQTTITVEQVAARCIEALRRFQPRGPYRLAGWCFSGVVAFEMARQLSLQGEQVPFLGLFDARGILPIRGSTLRTMWISWHENWIKIKFHFGALRKLGLGQAIEYSRARSQTIARRQVREFWKLSNSIFSALNRSTPIALRGPDHLAALALGRYQPEPYAGSLVHFWSKDRPPSPYRQFPGEWTPYVRGPMTVHEIPGNHVSMFQHPHVEILARQLQQHLP